MQVRASVIVVEYATARYLEACLTALERLEVPRDQFEVLVVDNASPTSPAATLARFAWVRTIRTPRNLGFAGACAAALPACRGEAIVTLNPDAVPAPEWLGALLEPFADAKVGVVGSKIYYAGTRILQHAGGILFPNGRTEHRGRGQEDVGQYDRLEDVAYVTGAAMAVRRAVVEQVGFFSPVYFPVYYEETELCLRARRAGWRVVYAPRAVCAHEEAVASGGGASRTFLERYHRSRIRFVLRNYSPAELALRFLPAELLFHLGRGAEERRICLRAYLQGARSARSAP